MGYYILDKDNNVNKIYDHFLRKSAGFPEHKSLFQTMLLGKKIEGYDFPIYYDTHQETVAGHLAILKTLL